jgi:hypothetical protein
MAAIFDGCLLYRAARRLLLIEFRSLDLIDVFLTFFKRFFWLLTVSPHAQILFEVPPNLARLVYNLLVTRPIIHVSSAHRSWNIMAMVGPKPTCHGPS